MKRVLSVVLCLALLLGTSAVGAFSVGAAEGAQGGLLTTDDLVYDATSVWEPNAGNPFIPGYIGDPFIFRDPDDGTFYVVGTTDSWSTLNTSFPFCIWESKDLVNWKSYVFPYEDGMFPKEASSLWAPALTKGPDGRFYLFYIYRGGGCYVAVCDKIGDPWEPCYTDTDPTGAVLQTDMFDSDVVCIDGTWYAVTMGRDVAGDESTDQGICLLELDFDYDKGEFFVVNRKLIYSGNDLFEGPGLFKRELDDGTNMYYLTYSNGSLGNGGYVTNVAYSKDIWGPYVKDEASNPILGPDFSNGMMTTGHNNVIEVDGDYYICYHRTAQISDLTQVCRIGAMEKLEFYSDGTLRKLNPTVNGSKPTLTLTEQRPNLAAHAQATESSYTDRAAAGVDNDWVGGYAFDNNYGTLWKADGTGDEWLQVDLGSTFTVEQVTTYFEWRAGLYNYQLYYSLDGSDWKLYADRSQNPDRGSVMEDVKTVEARYLKFVFDENSLQYVDDTVGIFEVKVFGSGTSLKLDEILVNDRPVDGFDANSNAVTAWVAGDAQAVLSYAGADADAQVTVTQPASVPGTGSITLTNPDTNESNTYTVEIKDLGAAQEGEAYFSNIPAKDSTDADAAFDGNVNSYFEGYAASGSYVGVDFGAENRVTVTGLRFVPRRGAESLVKGGLFQGSNDGKTWTTLYTVSGTPAAGNNYAQVSQSGAFRFVRYYGPANSNADIAEIEVCGTLSTVSASEALTSSIAYAQSLDSALFTADSFAAMKGKLQAAQGAVNGDDDAKWDAAEQLDEAVRALSFAATGHGTAHEKPDNGYLYNASFETSSDTHWENAWGIKAEQPNAHSGTHAVNINSTGVLRQTISGLKPGTYTFSLWVQGDGKGSSDTLDVYAVTSNGTLNTDVQLNGWQKWSKFEVRDVEVGSDGLITVGINSKLSAGSSMWAWVDDAVLEPQTDAPAPLDPIKVQDFENDPALTAGQNADVSLDTDIVHENGSTSGKLVVNVTAAAAGGSIEQNYIRFAVEGGSVDATGSKYLVFWMYDTYAKNNAYVQIYDGNGNMFGVWTPSGESQFRHWTKMVADLSGATIDLSDIREIRVALYNKNTYYVDNFYFVENADDAIPNVFTPTDKSQLIAEMEKVQAMDTSLYTTASVEKLEEVYDKANTVVLNTKARQVMVDDCLADLVAAKEELVPLGPIEINFRKLQQQVDRAEAIVLTEEYQALEENVRAAFEVILKEAKDLLQDPDATQIRVDDLAVDLSNAIRDLGLSGSTTKPGSGDVNGDGKINSTDARLVLQYTVELTTLTDEQKAAANVNGDAFINSSDARVILQMTVSLA